MLNLLLGRSGSGKSRYLREAAGKYIDSGKPVLVLVPEQFSFETGLYFLDSDSRAIDENVKILSFTTMIKYVFSLVGGLNKDFLDEGTSKILMSLAVESCSDSLNLYKKQIKNRSFVDTMLATINEYKSNCIASDDLLAVKAQVSNTTLKQKLEETALILDTYSTLVEGSYTHTQDILSYMAQAIEKHGIFNGYAVFIDAFTGFTGQQYRVLKAIMSQSDEVFVTLSTECRNNRVDDTSIRFRVTIDTYHRIRALADACSQQVHELYEPFLINRRTACSDLKAVEENLYAFPSKAYNITPQNVHIYSATNIYSECEYVASVIKQLTLSGKYRYKDIAVVCRDEDMYRGILDVTFEKFGIGYFMDKPQNINSKPLVNFIRHAFEAVGNGFNSESILRMLKTGITKYSSEDISVIENYIFTWSPKWSQPFNNNINGFSLQEMTPQEKELLTRIDAIRADVYEKLKAFKSATERGNGLELSKHLAELLYNFDVKNVIKEKIKRLKRQNTPELVDEYTRVWNSVISVISKMSNILQYETMTGKRYFELFTLAVNCEQIANQPLCLDRVIVGTAGRARLNSPKITFVIGAVQGVFPSVPTANGVFTDNERRLLLSKRLPLCCDLTDLAAQEQFSAYSTLASPSDGLYISYYTNTISGSGALPSTIVTQVQKILPQLKTEFECDSYKFSENQLWCKQQAFEHTISAINTQDSNKKALEEYFKTDKKYAALLEGICQYKEKEMPSISSGTAHSLYSEHMHLSASKIEDFYKCGYMYFCKSGLKLQERRKAGLDSRQYGSMVHYIMEKFLKLENIDDIVKNTSNYNIDEIVKEISQQFVEETFESNNIPDNKTAFALKRAEKSCAVLAKRIVNELKVSKFIPMDFELSIGIERAKSDNKSLGNALDEYKVKTKDGSVSITGFVDRVDLFKNPTDGKTYVRIVDYKTNNKELKLCDLEVGLSLQMFIYLSAILKNGQGLYGENLAPAGVCYMPSKEFQVTVDGGMTDEARSEVENSFNKYYCSSGLFLRDADIIMAMDETVSGKFIPVKVKLTKKKGKKGEQPTETISYPYSEKYLLSEENGKSDFEGIFKMVDDKIRLMSDMLLDGYISSVPTGSKNELDSLPCSYCLYKNACRFTPGMEVNLIPSDKAKEE